MHATAAHKAARATHVNGTLLSTHDSQHSYRALHARRGTSCTLLWCMHFGLCHRVAPSKKEATCDAYRHSRKQQGHVCSCAVLHNNMPEWPHSSNTHSHFHSHPRFIVRGVCLRCHVCSLYTPCLPTFALSHATQQHAGTTTQIKHPTQHAPDKSFTRRPQVARTRLAS